MTTIEPVGQTLINSSSQRDPAAFAGDYFSGNEHPQLSIPFSVVIEGRSYEGVAISLADARIAGLAGAQLSKSARLASFRFDFGSFVFSLPIAVSVITMDSATGQIVLRFNEPVGQHMPQLRYIINAWLAGDIINLNDMLQAKGRLPKTQAGLTTESIGVRVGNILGKFAGGLVAVAATAGLVVIAAHLLSQKLYVHTLEGPAIATQESMMMRATTSGQIRFLNLSAQKGDPLYTIQTSAGQAVTAIMPCNCKIAAAGQITDGATVLAGEPVTRLSSDKARNLVEARLSAEDLKSLAQPSKILIRLPDGRATEASAVYRNWTQGAAQLGDAVTVQLVPNTTLDDSLLGSPLVVEIGTTPSWLEQFNHFTSELIWSMRSAVGRLLNGAI